MSGPLQLFKVPAEQAKDDGMFVAGGWHAFIDHPDHGRVAVLPAEGDYSALAGLGYVKVPMPTPDAVSVAGEVLPDPAPEA